MSVFNMFGKKGQTENDIIRMLNPFPFYLCKNDFVRFKMVSIYESILTQCYLKSQDFPEEPAQTLWNNYNVLDPLYSRGVIKLIAISLAEQRTIAITYDRATNLAYEALGEKYNEIYEDYRDRTRSDKGVFLNFEMFDKSKLIKCYLELLYSALQAANAQLGLSRALKFKASELRKTQANISHDEWKRQGKEVVEAVKNGESVLIDKEDDLELTKLDVSPVTTAIEFYSQMIAGELNVSASFISGIIKSGMNSTGEADLEANEMGLRVFFSSVFKPACDELYKINIKFKTDNYRKTSELIRILPALETSEYVEDEQIKDYISYALGEK